MPTVHPRRIPLIVLLLLMSFGFATSAFAVRVEGLYQAEVPAAGQDEAGRNAALSSAFAAVLTKISGRTDVTAAPGLREAVARAASYAETFQFLTVADPQGADALRLQASFYPPAVDRLLADNGYPVWGRERPATIVWLAVDADGARYLLPADGGALADAVVEAAARRGLPVGLPIMDIDDRSALTYSDVAGGFYDRVFAASRRYGGHSVLIGHLRQRRPGDWDARWTHLLGGAERDWLGNGGGLGAALAVGIDGTADALAARYAVTGGTESLIEVDVAGVGAIDAYARTMNYLAGLSLVEDVQPRVVQPGRLNLRVKVKGDRQALADVIALGRVLEPDANLVDEGSGPLHFRILP